MNDEYDRNETGNVSGNEVRGTSSETGVYSARHYDYTGGTDKATYTTGSTGGYNSGEQRTKPVSNDFGTDKPGKDKKKGSFAGKLFATLGLGVVFGLTAGVTLFLMGKTLPGTAASGSDKVITGNSNSAVTQEKADEAAITGNAEDFASSAVESDFETEAEGSAVAVVTDVSDMVDAAMPSIVSITGKYIITGQSFWGQMYSEETEGSGSGIIIGQDDDKLYIATNNHVVEDSEGLKVQFIDGSDAEATIKGTDADVDLAVIIVDMDDLSAETKEAIKVAELGNSDDIKIGEPAVVIGNSLGYGQTVTYGVISAVDRTLEMDDGTVSKGLIQTDAAINPGNSGGALLNINGEVIGISSSKIGGSTIDGVGFAIPITSAQPILSDIVTSADRTKVSESKQGYLGIGGQTVTEEVSKMYGLPVGVLVRQVYEGTGAAESGLKQGDVITAIGGKSVKSMEELKEELQYYSKDEVIQITASRLSDGLYTDMTFDVRLVDKSALE